MTDPITWRSQPFWLPTRRKMDFITTKNTRLKTSWRVIDGGVELVTAKHVLHVTLIELRHRKSRSYDIRLSYVVRASHRLLQSWRSSGSPVFLGLPWQIWFECKSTDFINKNELLASQFISLKVTRTVNLNK